MLKIAALIPIGLFVVILAIVGVRLLLLARRTRELPELVLATGLLMMGFVGMPFCAIGRAPATMGTALGQTAFAVGIAVVVVGVAHLFAFTWLVFRREEVWARRVAIAAFVALAVIGVGNSLASSHVSDAQEIMARSRPWSFAIMGLLSLQFAWSGFESLAYYMPLRRRLALGMADPVVVNRFLLWGVASIAAVVAICGLVACLNAGMVIARDIVRLTLIATTAGLVSASWWLAFFPPRAYQSFLRRRAGL